MADENKGVELALEKAGDGPQAYIKIAALIGTTKQFVYTCRRKGFFPPEKARIVADSYGIPLADLVSARVRALLN